MDEEFDFDGTQSRRSEAPVQIWDILSILVLVLTIFLVGYFVLVFINPASSLNLLPPGGGVFGNPFPTATVTPLQMVPTWTASPTLPVTPSNTPRPTITPLPTSTSFSLVPPTKTPRPSATPTKARAPYTGSFTQVDSTVIHPELACNWAGVGGTVVDANNSPVIGIVVILRGTLNGSTVEQTTVSGINKEYGPSGFEFVLGTAPVASEETLYVQLVDQQSIPISDPVQITTSTECTKNLVMVRFKRNR
jgi:hypothetical protein